MFKKEEEDGTAKENQHTAPTRIIARANNVFELDRATLALPRSNIIAPRQNAV
jgi:hypothetical protein